MTASFDRQKQTSPLAALQGDPRTPRSSTGVRTFEAWPEHMLGLTTVELVDDEVVGSIETGPWLSWNGSTGAAGSLGVLVDVVLASAIVADRPQGMSSVSTEIIINTFGAVPIDGTRLTARARLIHRDHRGGFAGGEVRTEQGSLIAVASQRGRFVPTGDPPEPAHRTSGDDRSAGLERLLWPDGDRPRPGADGHVVLPAGPRFVNRLGNLHGGMSILLAEEVAMSAVRRDGDELTTASIHMGYVRPIPAGAAFTLEPAVLHRGRTSGVVRVSGRTGTGKLGTVATVVLH